METLPRNIALIGYRGSGKTTVAEPLALRLGWSWVDADVEVERRAAKSIAEIFADEGESAFRDMESLVVAQFCRSPSMVLALGGGAILRPENCRAIKSCGAVVWLHASIDAIEQRILADPATSGRRPNLTAAGGRTEIERLLAERTPHYRECATLEVVTDGKAPADIVDEILTGLGLT